MGRPRPSRPTRSQLRGGYLVQNPLWRAWLTLHDAWLASFHRSAAAEATQPGRVLVCVGGHLGDAVIASAAVAAVGHALPGVGIGVLSGSWNREVLSALPHVRWFHAVDHWRVNRSAGSFARRWMQYRESRSNAIRGMREVGYDAALDLYAYYPNHASVLKAAGIPVRIGYATGGSGALYTRQVEWKPGQRIREDHRALLERLIPGVSHTDSAYELGAPDPKVRERLDARLRVAGVEPGRFAVIHAGAGTAAKEWPMAHWIAVAREMSRADLRVVLTGAGTADTTKAHAIEQAVPGIVNLCNQLSWLEFRCVIARAAIVLSVDTVAMHVAAAEGTPCVAVLTGIDSPGRWVPDVANVRPLTHPVPCAPCYLSRGCDEMACVRHVEPARMLEAARSLVGASAR